MSEQTIKYQIPAEETLKAAENVLATAKAYRINSPEMAEAASEDLKSVKAKYKELENLRKSITEPMDTAKKKVMDLFRGPLGFLEEAESVLKRALLTYQQEEERRARELQAKLEENARKEREKLQAQADKAEARGKTEQAEALRENAQMAPTPIVSASPKLSGISTRKIWKAKVTDKRALVEAALTRADLMALILVDEQALNRLATALKENLSVPGVMAYSEENMSARASA